MGSILLSLAVKGTVVLVLGASAATLLRRAPAALRHCVWAVTFVALLAVPVLDALGPSWRVPVLPDTVSTFSAPLPERLGESATTPSVAFAPPVISASSGQDVSTIHLSAVSVATWLGRLWALGVLTVGFRWLREFALGRRLVRTSRVVRDRDWSARTHTAAQASGLRRPVVLRRSEILSVPVAWGWGQQTVLLPLQSDAWGAERAHAVLLHEMAHLRRRDAWTQAVAQAALALHWPNPLAWVAYGRFLNTREQACDDAVLQVGAAPTAYASHLVAIARELCPARLPLASATPLVGPDDLETRIRSILDAGRRRGRAGRWSVSATLALALAVGVPLAVFQPVASQTPPQPRSTRGASLQGPTVSVSNSADARAAGENRPQPERDAPPTEATRQRLEWSAPRDTQRVGHDSRMAEHDARMVGHDTRMVERDARMVERDARNVQTDARNAKTDARNAETDLRNAETDARNAETDARNALRSRPGMKTIVRSLDATRGDLESIQEEFESAPKALNGARRRTDATE